MRAWRGGWWVRWCLLLSLAGAANAAEPDFRFTEADLEAYASRLSQGESDVLYRTHLINLIMAERHRWGPAFPDAVMAYGARGLEQTYRVAVLLLWDAHTGPADWLITADVLDATLARLTDPPVEQLPDVIPALVLALLVNERVGDRAQADAHARRLMAIEAAHPELQGTWPAMATEEYAIVRRVLDRVPNQEP